VAPTLSNLSITPMILENGVATLTGTITDPGTLDDLTLTVDWGEGVPEMFSFTNTPGGTVNFTVTHQYLDDNPTATPQDDYQHAAYWYIQCTQRGRRRVAHRRQYHQSV
jgi:hypothetical protein